MSNRHLLRILFRHNNPSSRSGRKHGAVALIVLLAFCFQALDDIFLQHVAVNLLPASAVVFDINALKLGCKLFGFYLRLSSIISELWLLERRKGTKLNAQEPILHLLIEKRKYDIGIQGIKKRLHNLFQDHGGAVNSLYTSRS